MNATPNKPRKWFVGFSLEAAKLFGIGIVCLMVIWAAVIVSVKTGFAVPARWFALFFWTGALLWLIFRQHKDDLRIGEFWLALAAFLMVHVTVFAVVLQSYPAWRTIWFMFYLYGRRSAGLGSLGEFRPLTPQSEALLAIGDY